MSALKQNGHGLSQKQMPASKENGSQHPKKRDASIPKRQMPASIQKRRMPASKETDAHIQRRRILASKEDGCHHVLTTGIQASRRLTLMDEHPIIFNGMAASKKKGKLTCSVNWKHQGSKCYKLDQENRNFTESKQICENLNAEMIMPKTTEENEILSTIVKDNRTWIGLTGHDKKYWTWNDGTQLQSNTTWAKDFTANEDDNVTLTCIVDVMHANKSLFWTRSVDGTSVIVSEYAKGGNDTSHNLVFEHVKWTDEGSYKCNVINSSGMIQTVETRTLFVNTTNMHPCRCEYRRRLEHWGSKLIPNKSRQELLKELESELQKMKKDLEVNKTQLSSSIRRRSSAPDKRKSSERMGLAGAAFICIVVGLVILMDLLTIVKFLTNSITFWNYKKMERDKVKNKKRQMRKRRFEKNEWNTAITESTV
ncbi:unnamed protein product [Mytilus coruscus]|uniref:C-type lectin domain-containing protein n=1 Tax=Mytilus coruscus TaxID=42192 RepID=A0A6J8BN31_MYTCO|nr:unnamed protein product [Mytilus coruscus]